MDQDCISSVIRTLWFLRELLFIKTIRNECSVDRNLFACYSVLNIYFLSRNRFLNLGREAAALEAGAEAEARAEAGAEEGAEEGGGGGEECEF